MEVRGLGILDVRAMFGDDDGRAVLRGEEGVEDIVPVLRAPAVDMGQFIGPQDLYPVGVNQIEVADQGQAGKFCIDLF